MNACTDAIDSDPGAVLHQLLVIIQLGDQQQVAAAQLIALCVATTCPVTFARIIVLSPYLNELLA